MTLRPHRALFSDQPPVAVGPSQCHQWLVWESGQAAAYAINIILIGQHTLNMMVVLHIGPAL